MFALYVLIKLFENIHQHGLLKINEVHLTIRHRKSFTEYLISYEHIILYCKSAFVFSQIDRKCMVYFVKYFPIVHYTTVLDRHYNNTRTPCWFLDDSYYRIINVVLIYATLKLSYDKNAYELSLEFILCTAAWCMNKTENV